MPARVLIADDNSQNADLLGEYLEGGEFQVAVAADGEETLDKCAHSSLMSCSST